jgi:glutathione S-transferase
MKLLYADASPFARKVTVTIRELGLSDKVELAVVSTNPLTPNASVQAANPVAKIPSLLLDDGSSLYDSRVICEYLCSLAPGNSLFPAAGADRWTALRRQALGDAAMDAAVLVRYLTTLPPAEKRWDAMIDGQMAKIRNALAAADAEAASFGARVDIGTVTLGCMLGYLDFRFGDLGWRRDRPALAAWFERFSAIPSMAATAPKG